MKSSLQLLKERVQIYVKGSKKKDDVTSVLHNAGLRFEDASEEAGYTNIRIYTDDGYVRIYRRNGMKDFKVQKFRKCNLFYTGIPTFEPSGRESF